MKNTGRRDPRTIPSIIRNREMERDIRFLIYCFRKLSSSDRDQIIRIMAQKMIVRAQRILAAHENSESNAMGSTAGRAVPMAVPSQLETSNFYANDEDISSPDCPTPDQVPTLIDPLADSFGDSLVGLEENDSPDSPPEE